MSHLSDPMKPGFTKLVPLLASLGLHAGLLALLGSARGAESEPEPTSARFSGDTFEVETLVQVAKDVPPPSPPEAASEPEKNSPSQVPQVPPAAPASARVHEPEPGPEREAKPPEPEPGPAETVAPVPSALSPAPESEPSADLPKAEAGPPLPAALQSAERSDAEQAREGAPGEHLAPPANAASAPHAYGQAQQTARVGSLGRAFTRAAPRAAFRDPAWHALPMGRVGKVVFSIALDDAGRLTSSPLEFEADPEPLALLKHLVERAVLMLRAGSFALTPQGIEAGSQRFELSAQVRQVEALDDALAEPRDLRQIGRQVEPTRVRPGKANFTYNSGRQVELTVRLLAN